MSPSKTKRCAHPGCNHYEGVHQERRGQMPPHCGSCTGRRALHVFSEAEAVPA